MSAGPLRSESQKPKRHKRLLIIHANFSTLSRARHRKVINYNCYEREETVSAAVDQPTTQNIALGIFLLNYYSTAGASWLLDRIENILVATSFDIYLKNIIIAVRFFGVHLEIASRLIRKFSFSKILRFLCEKFSRNHRIAFCLIVHVTQFMKFPQNA